MADDTARSRWADHDRALHITGTYPPAPEPVVCDDCGTRFPPGTDVVTLPAHRCAERQARRSERLDALLQANVRFWQCPVEEHWRRRGAVTVEWGDDGVARCTFPGCDRTSARPSPSGGTAPVPDGPADRVEAALAAAPGIRVRYLADGGSPGDLRTDMTAALAAALASPPAAEAVREAAEALLYEVGDFMAGRKTSERDLPVIDAANRLHVALAASPPAAPTGEPGRDEVDALARLLIAEWRRVEGPFAGSSYVATFADMARAALAAGYRSPAPAPSGEPGDTKPRTAYCRAALDCTAAYHTTGCSKFGPPDPDHPARVAGAAWRALREPEGGSDG